MNLSFLQNSFLGISIYNYIIAGVLILMSFFMRKYLSVLFAKIFFFFFKKIADNKYALEFQTHVLTSLQSLLVTILLYAGVYRLYPIIDKVQLYTGSRKSKQADPVTMMDALDVIFQLLILYYITKLVSKIIDFVFMVIVEKVKERKEVEKQQIYPLLNDMVRVLVWVMGILAILGIVFQVNVAALVAGMGIGGLAIAFAAKDSLENLLSSILLLVDRPFLIGDWVLVGGVEGTVEKIGFRSTHIRTFDKSVVAIPNRKLLDSNLENFTQRSVRRVKFEVGAIYGLSLTKLQTTSEMLKQAIDKHANTDQQAAVYLDNFGDSSVNFVIIYFIKVAPNVNFVKVKEEINLAIYQVMYEYANGFAFPTQLSIHGEDVNEVIKQ